MSGTWTSRTALAFFLIFIFYSTSLYAKSTIQWTPSLVSTDITAGQKNTTTVSFVSSEDVEGTVDVTVVPELEPFVATTPTSYNGLTEGQEETIDITFFSRIDRLHPLSLSVRFFPFREQTPL